MIDMSVHPSWTSRFIYTPYCKVILLVEQIQIMMSLYILQSTFSFWPLHSIYLCQVKP